MAPTWEAAHNAIHVRNLGLPFPKMARNSSRAVTVCSIQHILCQEFQWEGPEYTGIKLEDM